LFSTRKHFIPKAGGSKLDEFSMKSRPIQTLGAASLLHISAIAAAFVLSVLAMYLFPTNAGRASALVPRAVSWLLAVVVAASIALSQLSMPMGISQRLAACGRLPAGVVGDCGLAAS
jgi:hypothetical protein